MCGIAGVVTGVAIDRARLQAMANVITHRGPDGAGEWVSSDGCVGLAHRRLSIIDLSPAGAQPMASASGRYTLTFNGEIYNFQALRKALDGATFRGHSDTEVMLAAFERWGVAAAIAKFDGMFAFAVWDAQEQMLWLARDRLGIKPLFYSMEQGELSFASELRPLVAWRGALPHISAQGLTEYMRLGYVPGPLSIFEHIHKLQPGHYITLRGDELSKPHAYWRFSDAARSGLANPFTDETEALDALEATLKRSISGHMISDVPLGAFLSGGIDSSTVAALMQAQSSRAVKTFSIGFHEAGFNEAEHAKAVAAHLGTEHTELYVTDSDARDVIPQLADMYDEPFADASQIPTFLVAKLAREQVTVALSGDGGDELFAGYNRYVFVSRFWKRLRYMPAPVRTLVAQLLAAPSSSQWDKWFRAIGSSLPTPGQKMQKIAAILPSSSLLALHGRLVSQWAVPEQAVAHAHHGRPLWESLLADTPAMPPAAQQMLWDAQTYMVDDILTKVDRATMRVGLEARVPLIDHHVAELAWRVPLHMKLRGGESKWLLKQLLYRYVPKTLVERPKMGFSVPVDAWLRGPLREWAESYVSEKRLREEGYLQADAIRQNWQQHQSGAVDRGGMLWTVLMFQLWLEGARRWV